MPALPQCLALLVLLFSPQLPTSGAVNTNVNDHTSEILAADINTQSVQLLLRQWGLSKTFGKCFAENEVSGRFVELLIGMYHNAVDGDGATVVKQREQLDELQAHLCPKATLIHWVMLFDQLEQWEAAVYKAEVETKSSPYQPGHDYDENHIRRQLSNSGARSGIKIAHDQAVISLGQDGDVTVARSGDSALAIDAAVVNVTGTVHAHRVTTGVLTAGDESLVVTDGQVAVEGTLSVNGDECVCVEPTPQCSVGPAQSSPAEASAAMSINDKYWMDLDMEVRYACTEIGCCRVRLSNKNLWTTPVL